MDPKELREQVIKDAKCKLILDAAHAVFAQKGYWDARLEDIAAAVGFSKASLYNYYPDKESIFLSLSIREYRGLFEAIDEESKNEKPFLDSIEAILRIVFGHFSEHFAFLVNINNFQNMIVLQGDMAKHPELSGELHALVHKGIFLLKTVVDRAKDRNAISPLHDSTTLAIFISSLVQSLQMLSWQSGRAVDVETAIRQIINFLKFGAGMVTEKP